MPETKKQQHSWVAGLKEQRIALGIAAAASLAMIVLLVLAPNMAADNKDSANKTRPASDTPVYAIPERQQVKAAKTHKPARSTAHKPTSPPPKTHKKPATRQKTISEKVMSHKSKPAISENPKIRSKTAKTAQHSVFFVQVAAYREKNSAQQQAASLMQKGWNSMVTRNNKGLYVVRIGPVSNRPEAIVLHRKLIDKAQLKGFIVQGR